MSTAKNRRKSKKTEAGIPPHANVEVHAAIMKRLSGMSAEEIFETAVRSGIYTKTGKLKKPYASAKQEAR